MALHEEVKQDVLVEHREDAVSPSAPSHAGSDEIIGFVAELEELPPGQYRDIDHFPHQAEIGHRLLPIEILPRLSLRYRHGPDGCCGTVRIRSTNTRDHQRRHWSRSELCLDQSCVQCVFSCISADRRQIEWQVN